MANETYTALKASSPINTLLTGTEILAVAASGVSKGISTQQLKTFSAGPIIAAVAVPFNLAGTYNNGVSGIGATLTVTTITLPWFVNGYAVQLNDDILLPNQNDPTQNWVYRVTALEINFIVLTRPNIADNSPTGILQNGQMVCVTAPLISADVTASPLYVLDTQVSNATIAIGTTPLYCNLVTSDGFSTDGILQPFYTNNATNSFGLFNILFRQAATFLALNNTYATTPTVTNQLAIVLDNGSGVSAIYKYLASGAWQQISLSSDYRNISAAWGFAFSVPQATSFQFEKIGNTVTCYMPTFSAIVDEIGGSLIVSPANTVPPGFQPLDNITLDMTVLYGADYGVDGNAQIDSDGSMHIFPALEAIITPTSQSINGSTTTLSPNEIILTSNAGVMIGQAIISGAGLSTVPSFVTAVNSDGTTIMVNPPIDSNSTSVPYTFAAPSYNIGVAGFALGGQAGYAECALAWQTPPQIFFFKVVSYLALLAGAVQLINSETEMMVIDNLIAISNSNHLTSVGLPTTLLFNNGVAGPANNYGAISLPVAANSIKSLQGGNIDISGTNGEGFNTPLAANQFYLSKSGPATLTGGAISIYGWYHTISGMMAAKRLPSGLNPDELSPRMQVLVNIKKTLDAKKQLEADESKSLGVVALTKARDILNTNIKNLVAEDAALVQQARDTLAAENKIKREEEVRKQQALEVKHQIERKAKQRKNRK